MNFPKEFQKWNDATGNFWTNNCMDIRSQRNDGSIISTAVAVFIAGLILGGLLVPHESKLMRIASNDARTVISLAAAPATGR